MLNTFAYTCGMGVVAAAGGAARVVNTDHGSACLEIGAANAELNGLSMEFLQVRGKFYLPPSQPLLAGLPGRTACDSWPPAGRGTTIRQCGSWQA